MSAHIPAQLQHPGALAGLGFAERTTTPLSTGGLAGPKLVGKKSEESLVEEEELSDENVVKNLLSAWTNLPPRPNQE